MRIECLGRAAMKCGGILFAAFGLLGADVVCAAEQTPIDTGTTAWMLISTGLVLLMVPGLAMFYGGLVRSKNVLGTMMHSFVSMAIIGVLWAVCGYALSFGRNVLGGWVGWFGFNAGSTVSSGLETARALTMTQISAASGALTWVVIEALHLRKATSLGFVTGILAGLVVITPAAGVVQPAGALVLGALSSMACYSAILLKYRLRYDDTLDVFGVHGIGSGFGVVALCFFIRPSWMEEAAKKAGAWSAWSQLGVQATGLGITLLYAGVVTLLLAIMVNKTMGFRLDEKDEMVGMDQSLHGERGYGLLEVR